MVECTNEHNATEEQNQNTPQNKRHKKVLFEGLEADTLERTIL